MLDASDLVDRAVTAQRSNILLLPLLNNDPTKIFATYHIDPAGTNFEQKIQEQPRGTIMFGWRGTETGNFAKMEATRHALIAYLRPVGKATEMFQAFMNGICYLPEEDDHSYGARTGKFRLITLHPKCYPPVDIALAPQPIIIGRQLAIYDTLPITFTMIEKGLDV